MFRTAFDCKECGTALPRGQMDKLCYSCEKKNEEKIKTEFLENLKILSIEERLAKLEEAFFNHITNHPKPFSEILYK